MHLELKQWMKSCEQKNGLSFFALNEIHCARYATSPPSPPSSSSLNVKLCASLQTFCPSQDMTFSICQHFPHRTGEVGPRSGILFRVVWWDEEHPLQYFTECLCESLWNDFHRLNVWMHFVRWRWRVERKCQATGWSKIPSSNESAIPTSFLEPPSPPLAKLRKIMCYHSDILP